MISLLIVNNYSEFQVNVFSNNRDIRLHIENSKSKKGHNFVKNEGLPSLLVWVPRLIVNNCHRVKMFHLKSSFNFSHFPISYKSFYSSHFPHSLNSLNNHA